MRRSRRPRSTTRCWNRKTRRLACALTPPTSCTRAPCSPSCCPCSTVGRPRSSTFANSTMSKTVRSAL
ncbi:hypothetical protein PF005_g30867 [Phytophthora fragariae]|uniref:Uncharacterized protein n=1 Tax=Phytophthora fragariae TaxID=53985 RepID=A0A6A3V7W6_9STRA|nr:hypothetical protein PF009_g31043 [Phytophthora fragariae]KAE8960497.1 hypothetical protein PF011_g30072 [Phytophthora fragariae]KAE9059670.1 hypothetical protein PF010_g30528 [Phytophthora fragariae]KAE9060616.1 hypothetical protein PF007_g30541 [Phytophthora fragariae]KAE9064666.1 hypothetical protein PF006_g30641 [Phytophthora fragariae]